MTQEADRLAKRIPSGAHRIVLDERGDALGSDPFAARLAALRDWSLRDLVFVIGRPDGRTANFRKDAVE
jgi:23S rRNA (pseudouridine1915-N3)-methyltransferase